jgi:hypothetical protein
LLVVFEHFQLIQPFVLRFLFPDISLDNLLIPSYRLDFTPSGRLNGKREIQHKRRIKMGKQDKERRVYTREFKAEAAALAEKHEKPVRLIAAD